MGHQGLLSSSFGVEFTGRQREASTGEIGEITIERQPWAAARVAHGLFRHKVWFRLGDQTVGPSSALAQTYHLILTERLEPAASGHLGRPPNFMFAALSAHVPWLQLEHVAHSVPAPRAPMGAADPYRVSSRRETELEWRRTHQDVLRAYVGQWVAVEGDRIVASGSSLAEAARRARAKGVAIPYVFLVDGLGPNAATLGL